MITSFQNPFVKLLLRLREKHVREKEGLFLIEGYREIARAEEVEIEELLICPKLFLGENEDALIEKIGKAKITECSSQIFEKVSYRDRPDGLLAVAKLYRKGLDLLEISSCPFLVIAESIEKPGNLGSILRSSDAAGVDAVIVVDGCTDLFNPNVIRSSVGTLFTQPVIEAISDEVITFLKEKKIAIIAATPHAKTFYTKADFTKPLAIAVGTEHLGLSEKWLNACDLEVAIPMKGVADSLNVAQATTILLYEVQRQRS